MNSSYEDFRGGLLEPRRRAAMGLDLSDAEASRVAADDALARAYFANWRSQNSANGARPSSSHTDGAVGQSPGSVPTEAPASRGIGCFGLTVIVLIFAIIVIIIANVATRTGGDGSTAADAGQQAATEQQPVAVEKTDAQLQDEAAVADGWKVGVSGDIYLMAADAGTFTCGTYDCLWYTVTSVQGCTGGVYVQVDIMSNGTAVGWTNVISPSISPRESVAVQVEDYEGFGDAFRVSEVSCMS